MASNIGPPSGHRRLKEKKQHGNDAAVASADVLVTNSNDTSPSESQDFGDSATTSITTTATAATPPAAGGTPAMKPPSVVELDTEDKLEYQFHPVTNGVVNFKVRAPNDAHLALTSQAAESDQMLEVFIGGWKNTKSVIRKNRAKPDVCEVDTPDILNAGEFRGFWVRWMDNVITVGMEGAAAAFMSYENPDPFPIDFVGVCTGWGASGSWIIEQNEPAPSAPAALVSGAAACWVPAANGEIPPNAVVGGSDGEDLYVGRARHEGAVIPGKVAAGHGVCYIAWGGGEHSVAEYEVLCDGNGTFVPVSGGEIPPNAIPAGETEDGEPLFIGRVPHEGTLTIGKVQQTHGVCYIPYGGQELAFADYEIYVSE